MLDFLPYFENSIKHPVKLNILDLIILNPITMNAHKWVFTDSEGFVKFNYLKSMPFSDIAKSLLANFSPPTMENELAQLRRIVFFAYMKK